MYRTMGSRAALWGQLPLEILEQVLLCVPVRNLCRFRCVSKRWNQLITNREFGAQYALKQHASGRQASFIVLYGTRLASNLSSIFEEHPKWGQFCFLDLSSRRWSRHSSNAADELCSSFWSLNMDMNGGLVVGPRYASSSGRPSSPLVVQNLTAPNSRKELPSPPDHWSSSTRSHRYCLLNLVVDTVTQTFKIFLLNSSFQDLEDPDITWEERTRILNDPMLCLYNSATNEWKALTNPSCISSMVLGQSEFQVNPARLVMLRDTPHILFTSNFDHDDYFHTGIDSQLWRYNLHEDLWEDMHCELCHPGELIVSADFRLFLFGWACCREEREFEVTEINIPDKRCELLFAWSEAEAMDVFDIQWIPESIEVTSFDNSLMFMYFRAPGKLISYNYVTKEFDREWPPLTPLEDLPDRFKGTLRYGQFCAWKQMNLLLPGTPF